MKSIAYAIVVAAALGVAAFAPDPNMRIAGAVWVFVCGVLLLIRNEK